MAFIAAYCAVLVRCAHKHLARLLRARLRQTAPYQSVAGIKQIKA